MGWWPKRISCPHVHAWLTLVVFILGSKTTTGRSRSSCHSSTIRWGISCGIWFSYVSFSDIYKFYVCIHLIYKIYIYCFCVHALCTLQMQSKLDFKSQVEAKHRFQRADREDDCFRSQETQVHLELQLGLVWNARSLIWWVDLSDVPPKKVLICPGIYAGFLQITVLGIHVTTRGEFLAKQARHLMTELIAIDHQQA